LTLHPAKANMVRLYQQSSCDKERISANVLNLNLKWQRARPVDLALWQRKNRLKARSASSQSPRGGIQWD